MGTVAAIDPNLRVTVNKRHPLQLIYAFESETGRRYEGRSTDLPRALEQRWQEGDPIVVVFDPVDPSRNDVDLFGLRANEGSHA